MPDIATMQVEGMEYSGWKTLSIPTSIENCATAFNFEASLYDPAKLADYKLLEGMACKIALNSDKVVDGYIDSVKLGQAPDNRSINISGRSKTADAVDCSAICDTGHFKKQKIEIIATVLNNFYKIATLCDVNTGDAILKHVVETGETVYQSIERAARLKGLLITDTIDGQMHITRAGSSRAHDALIVGENVKSTDASFATENRYSEYRVHGQTKGSDKIHGQKACQNIGIAKDPLIKRPRVLIIKAEGQANKEQCQTRANWESAIRAAKSIRINVVVKGWHQSNGQLWTKNSIVQYVNKDFGISAEFLIVDATYEQSNDGTSTTMTLSPPESYQPLEITKKTANKNTTNAFEDTLR